LIIRVSREEKIRIQGYAKNGRYPFISDYIRVRIFNSSRKVITFDEEATIQILRLDYDLNKIGVNLNQIAKKSIPTMCTNLPPKTEGFLSRSFRNSKIVFLHCDSLSLSLTNSA